MTSCTYIIGTKLGLEVASRSMFFLSAIGSDALFGRALEVLSNAETVDVGAVRENQAIARKGIQLRGGLGPEEPKRAELTHRRSRLLRQLD